MKRKELRNRRNDVLIKRYGEDILRSEEFGVALSQKHHHRSSVGDHSILTARAGLTMCNLINKAGISVDTRKVVRISLLHDLGMLGREDPESVDAIRSHMWPLSASKPSSKEAVILCLADKVTALGDCFNPKNRKVLSPILG